MLGIFDINIPLLYGEGNRAFIRLQEEIIRISNDQTIFCWDYPRKINGEGGFLAFGPAAFAEGWQNMMLIHHITSSFPSPLDYITGNP